MRLKCPNCDAQYEVSDDVLPEEGRDVQCSNCGNTWFQSHPDHPDESSETAHPADDEDVVRTDDVEHAGADHAPAPEPKPSFEETEDYGYDDDGFEDDREDSIEDEPDANEPTRRELDPSVAEILRAEAEMEADARRREMGGSVESQPDLGLEDAERSDGAEKRAQEARERMARMRGEDPDDDTYDTVAAAAIGSRRDLLPDIEEINSTLRSGSDRAADGDPTELANVEVREKRSFRRGFRLIVLLAVVLLLIYVFAPSLANAVPQLDPWLSAYVGMIDQWRLWLDTQMSSMLPFLEAVADSSSE